MDTDFGDSQRVPDTGVSESGARQICLRLLARRAHTRAELAAALDKRGVPPAVADKVLTRFVEVGLIDDEAFAANWAQSRQRTRGLSRNALAYELRQHGVENSTIEHALEQITPSQEEEAARRLVERKLRTVSHLEQKVQRRRLLAMLARKGHSVELAYRIVRQVLEEIDND